MLLTRVITALLLLALLCAVLAWGGQTGWLMFVGVAVFASFWEWARLGQLAQGAAVLYAIAGTAAYLALEFIPEKSLLFPLLAASGVFWVIVAPWCLRQVNIGPLSNRWVYLFTGVVLIAAAGVALTKAHSQGVVFLISLLAICAAADIFAYVFGKLLGQRKLAPRVSPGKSWEGAAGGTFSVIVLSFLVVIGSEYLPLLKQSWQFRAYAEWPLALYVLWLVGISAISIVGDLFESMLKRRAGLKDSSHLLPGHGGVLDRIDAQLPVLPLGILLLSSSGSL